MTPVVQALEHASTQRACAPNAAELSAETWNDTPELMLRGDE